MLILFCIWYLNFKGGKLYLVPPSVPWLGAGCPLVPVGLPWGLPCAVAGPCYFMFNAVRCEYRGGWGVEWVGGWFVVVGRAYLNSATPALSSHCGLCTLILCAGTRDLLMHRCVARTKVILILLLTYLHIFE